MNFTADSYKSMLAISKAPLRSAKGARKMLMSLAKTQAICALPLHRASPRRQYLALHSLRKGGG